MRWRGGHLRRPGTPDAPMRLAPHDGRLYLDLGAPTGPPVAIGPDGWAIVTDPPVRFRRPRAGWRPALPVPGATSTSCARSSTTAAARTPWRLLVSATYRAPSPPRPLPGPGAARRTRAPRRPRARSATAGGPADGRPPRRAAPARPGDPRTPGSSGTTTSRS